MKWQPGVWLTGIALLISPLLLTAQSFHVATYNVENYLDRPTETRTRPKTTASKAAVRESIRALKPDVLALQEMGSPSAFEELRTSLKSAGVDFPYWEYVAGFDTNIHVAVLSRFPFTARRPHTNDTFLLGGRRWRVGRGFCEVEVKVNPHYSFTLITTHLKSKRPVAEADEAEQRLEEAKVLRRIVDARLTANPGANLVVLGDLNDTKDSLSTRHVIGRGKFKLIDTRPAERNGDATRSRSSASQARSVTWTHYYGIEDTYSRIDYILLSPGMAREWVENESYVLAMPDWGVASDHRPLMATFHDTDK